MQYNTTYARVYEKCSTQVGISRIIHHLASKSCRMNLSISLPHAVYSIHMCGGALTISYNIPDIPIFNNELCLSKQLFCIFQMTKNLLKGVYAKPYKFASCNICSWLTNWCILLHHAIKWQICWISNRQKHKCCFTGKLFPCNSHFWLDSVGSNS